MAKIDQNPVARPLTLSGTFCSCTFKSSNSIYVENMTSQEQNYDIAKKQKEAGDKAFREGDLKAGKIR